MLRTDITSGPSAVVLEPIVLIEVPLHTSRVPKSTPQQTLAGRGIEVSSNTIPANTPKPIVTAPPAAGNSAQMTAAREPTQSSILTSVPSQSTTIKDRQTPPPSYTLQIAPRYAQSARTPATISSTSSARPAERTSVCASSVPKRTGRELLDELATRLSRERTLEVPANDRITHVSHYDHVLSVELALNNECSMEDGEVLRYSSKVLRNTLRALLSEHTGLMDRGVTGTPLEHNFLEIRANQLALAGNAVGLRQNQATLSMSYQSSLLKSSRTSRS